jgi:predicted esterase
MSTSDRPEPASMKNGEIKAELKELGVTDLRHCVEKSDLVAELVKARANPPTPKPSSSPANVPDEEPVDDGRLTYGKVKLAGNQSKPTAMMLFLHGLGDTCDGWVSMMPQLASANPHVLFVLPTAAQQRVTLNMGMAMTSWYDIKGLTPDAPEDTLGMRRSAAYMDKLIAEYTEQFGIAQNRVVYGGFSQGACMALFRGLTTSRGAPAGVCALSGYAGSREWVLEHLRHKDVPIFMAHGTQDPVVPFMMSQLSKAGLEGQGKVSRLEYKTYPMGHSACDEELRDVTAWLSKAVPRQ